MKKSHLIQVDNVQLLTGNTMEHATLLVEKDYFKWFELFCELSGSDIGVDVQNLTVWRFRKTGEDREGTSPDRCLQGPFIDFCDFTYKAILVAVEVIGRKDT
jgi:hypothetical protein